MKHSQHLLSNVHSVISILGLMLIVTLPLDFAFAQADEREERELKENSAAREQFRYMQRRGENGKIPFGALVSAKTQIDLRRAKNSNRIPDDAGIWNWEWLGPGNIGGRVRAVLIHPTSPSLMWIGSVSGGIWRTVDGGASWTPVDDFMADLAVTSIVMDPTNSNIMYASTGEGFIDYGDENTRANPGAGIFKSTDGGTTWNQLPSTNNPNFVFVNRLAHHPTAPNTLIAVSNGGIVRTTNGGAFWETLNGSPNGTDVKYNPSNPSVIVVGTYTNLILSTDGGASFQRQTTGAMDKLPDSPGRCEVAFTPANANMVYTLINTNKGEVWRSANNGSTWERRYTVSSGETILEAQGHYANVIAVSPVDQDFVLAGGLNLWKSTNGGTSFERISYWPCYPSCVGVSHSAHADQHAIVFHPGFDGSTNKTVFVGNDGGIQMTTDITTVGTGPLGDGWISLANGLGITQFYGGAASPNGTIIGGTQDNSTLRFNGGVDNWDQWITGDGGACAIDQSAPNFMYSEYINLQIFKSIDFGTTYFPAQIGLSDAAVGALFIAPFVMDPNNSLSLVAGGKSIWRTIDGAATWSSIRDSFPPQFCSAIDFARSNSSVIWVGYTGGKVSFTSDGGVSWNDVDEKIPRLPDKFVTDIAINPSQPGEVFVTFGGYESNDIWMTSNFGDSWEQRQGYGLTSVPAIQVNTVRYHPVNQNWVYVGTDLGLFASEDKGLTWNTTPAFKLHDGPANVEIDELFWQNNEYLIAATHGRGMYRSRPLSIVHVDVDYVGPEDGSFFRPYNTVQEAIDAAGNGTYVSINIGTYPQSSPLVISKRVKMVAPNGNATIK